MATVTQPHKTRQPKKSTILPTAPSLAAGTAGESLPDGPAQRGEALALRLWVVCFLLMWLLSLVPFLTGVWK
jgi:hypothetical protein